MDPVVRPWPMCDLGLWCLLVHAIGNRQQMTVYWSVVGTRPEWSSMAGGTDLRVGAQKSDGENGACSNKGRKSVTISEARAAIGLATRQHRSVNGEGSPSRFRGEKETTCLGRRISVCIHCLVKLVLSPQARCQATPAGLDHQV
ncbi:hypothetical protein RRG08_056178 [Elysia crispata]|uniref:Uncharacterized protein n=1 Tax=Elysia crispata TaxID=231223 RepID=A0AAE0Z2N5_9GAST|nr:hypothetical protein RRG08_056178 [Elysia crispata]